MRIMERTQFARLVDLLHYIFDLSCGLLGRNGSAQLGQTFLEVLFLGDLAKEARKVVALLGGDLRGGRIRGCCALEKLCVNQ